MEVSTPVLPSLRVGTRAPAGILYLPLGTFPEGAPPACSFAAARAARAISTPPAAACRNFLLEAMQYLLPREAAHAAPTRHPTQWPAWRTLRLGCGAETPPRSRRSQPAPGCAPR